jgi:iron complex outermembrane recepter protein
MFTKSFPLASLSAAILSVIFAGSAVAAEEKTEKTEKLEKVETVLVSATRSETANVPVATQIKVISAEDIRLSGAKLLSEVLRTQAGIQLTDSDGSGARNVTVSMRGLSGANNTLILVDGRKLNNPSLAAPALNTVALKDVERIEIVQGSAGVLYGDQAVGGVINIITRRAVAGEVDGSIGVTAGSNNLEDYTASVRQGFENGLSYSASAQKRNADNYRDNNESSYENILANVRYDFKQGFVFVEGQKINDDLNLAGYLLDSEAEINPRKAQTPTDYSNQKTDLARVGGGVDLADNWQFLAEYADRDEDTLSYYGYGDPTLGNMRVKNITPRVIGKVPTDNGAAIITLGYDDVSASYVVADWGKDIEQDIDAYYAQIVYPLTKDFAVTVGARQSSVDDENHASKKKHSDDTDASEIGVSYQIDSGWKTFARIADGFRFANADENALVLPGVTFLETQTSRTKEAGFVWSSKEFSSQITFYDMTLDNELMYDAAIPNPNAYKKFGANINLDESKRKGLVFDSELTLSSQIALRANYTYTDTELTTGSFAGNEVPFVAKNSGNVAVVFSFVKDLMLTVDSTYTGSRYRTGDQANSHEKTDLLNLFNASLLWQIQNVELGARVKNINNEKYAGLQGYSPTKGNYLYPQPERNYEASIIYRF